MPTKLLFLHGVGKPPTIAWQPELNDALQDEGFVRLDQTDVIEPDYRRVLAADEITRVEPPTRYSQPKETLPARRAEYERAQSSMRRLLALDVDAADRVRAYPADLADLATSLATRWPLSDLKQARLYCSQEPRRLAVITTVLRKLGTSDDLVIIGHSLGTLVALDLLPHLNDQVVVRRLITIGGPLGIPWMHERSERLMQAFPYGQVRSWLNVLSTRDLITARRKAVTLFPPAIDLIMTPDYVGTDATRHGAADYLREAGAAKAVGEAMFGTTNLPAPVEVSPELRPTDQEYLALFGIAFAHLVASRLEREDKEAAKRYHAALSVVQTEIHRRLTEASRSINKSLGRVVDDLSTGAAPSIPRRWEADLDGCVRLLCITATTNLINPYEIDAPKATLSVLPAAAVGLGFGQNVGEKVAQGITEARKCFSASWFTWQRMLIGAGGVALLAAGPVGLALAAPAGLAGGAVITSALAAFGPGGMVGGMALAGALVSSGAMATTAAALIDQPASVLELEVLRRMTHAFTRKQLDLPSDLTDWGLLVAMAHDLDLRFDRLGAFSDERSETMTSLRAKRAMLAKAIEWMTIRGLTPPQIET